MEIEFNANVDKAIEVILWLANKKPGITYHSLLKFLFYADEYHLNKYGRPIVGDSYVAMPFGPVASLTYDLLKKNIAVSTVADNIDKLNFSNNRKKITPERESNTYYLSKSDIEALEFSFQKYENCCFGDFCDSTHKHKAWINSKPSLGCRNKKINYADLIEDAEMRQELEMTSKYISL